MSGLRPTLYHVDWILPVSAPPIHRGALLVSADGQIAAVAPREGVDAPADARVVDLGAAVLLPGLINVHGHADLAMFRGALEDLPFHDWITRLVGTKRAHLTDDDHSVAARWTSVEAIRAGITTLACTEASAAALDALRESGMRGVVYQEVFGPDPAAAVDSMKELRRAIDAARVRETDLVRIGVSPHAPYTVSDRLYREVTGYAVTEELPLALHIAESAAERVLVVEGEGPFAPGLRARGISTISRGDSPVELLERLGVLRARPLLIHCVDLDAEDLRRVVGSGSAVAHCPVANAKLGHGIAPVQEMLDAGMVVGLGSDSVGSNNRLDLLEEARIAALMQRARLTRPEILPPSALLRLCTLEGARALGLDNRVGALEPGLDADLCAVSLRGAHARPVIDPVATLFHSARASDVILTVVRGRTLLEGGVVRTMDETGLGMEIDRLGERIRGAL